jgi:hypothetical protein
MKSFFLRMKQLLAHSNAVRSRNNENGFPFISKVIELFTDRKTINKRSMKLAAATKKHEKQNLKMVKNFVFAHRIRLGVKTILISALPQSPCSGKPS